VHIKDGAVVDDDADHARFFEGDIRNLAVIYFHDAVEGRGVVGNEFHIRDEAVIGLHIIAGEGIVEEERLFVDTEAFALCDIARIDIGDVFHDVGGKVAVRVDDGKAGVMVDIRQGEELEQKRLPCPTSQVPRSSHQLPSGNKQATRAPLFASTRCAV